MFEVKKNFNLSKGFTLVELLVVIAIIGILATLILLQLGTVRQKARDAKRIADIVQVRQALELYYDDNGSYPAVATFSALAGDLAPKYLTIMPSDPLNTGNYAYGYAYDPTGSPIRFQVWAELEQWAAGLNSDADINSLTWFGGVKVNGTIDAKTGCVNGTAADCVYDQGQL